jgi:hypothetical protein
MSAKGLVLRGACIAAWREALRSPQIPAETKAGALFLAGVVVAPFAVVFFGGSFLWWLLTGKRLPGPIGRWTGPPATALVNAYPKQLRNLPPDILAVMKKIEEP